MENCVSVSASVFAEAKPRQDSQQIKAPLSPNNIYLDNQSRFCCKDELTGISLSLVVVRGLGSK